MNKYLLLSICYILFSSEVYASSFQVGDLVIEFTKRDESSANIKMTNIGKTTMKPIKINNQTIKGELKPNKSLTTGIYLHKIKKETSNQDKQPEK